MSVDLIESTYVTCCIEFVLHVMDFRGIKTLISDWRGGNFPMGVSTELFTKDRTVCRVVTVIVLFVVLACFNFDFHFPQIIRTGIREVHEDWTTPNLPISSKEMQPPSPEPSILDKLKELSRLASDGHDYTLTAAERKAWHTQNPCQSRSELPAMYAARKHVKDISSNPGWDEVFVEYSKLHRICLKRVGNVTEHFLNKSNVSIPGCKFLVGQGTNGLGNKLLVTVSTVLYAIATQRILVMPLATNLKSVLCEPFVGSSWMLEADDLLPPRGEYLNTSWVEENVFVQSMSERLESVEEAQETGNRTPTASRYLPPIVDAVAVSTPDWGHWQPQGWFYCSREQKFLSEIPWVYMSGCLYSIPKIFGSPFFRASLKTVFPDNLVSTRLLRSTLLPSDPVWNRFKHLNHAYFQEPDRRVAVQMRFYENGHESMSSLVNDRVLDCVIKNGILPNVSESSMPRKFLSSAAPIATVFIASLYSDLRDHLSEFYLRSATESGEDVNVVQITNHLYQSSGVEEDSEALVEVLLLSVSDVLLVTPWSTFGGLAHIYGGLTPWFVHTHNSSSSAESCERGESVDDCQIDVSEDYNCPDDDPEIGDTDDEPPILGRCYYFGAFGGVQVLPARSVARRDEIAH